MMETVRIAASVLAALVTTEAWATSPGYPLLCHGGPTMRITEEHELGSAGVLGATSMVVHFKASSVPGSVHPPGPGECTWMDRTVADSAHPNEPTAFLMKSQHIQFTFQVMGSGQIVRDAAGPKLGVEGSPIWTDARDWQAVVHAVMNGALFTVLIGPEGTPDSMAVSHVGL